MQPTAKARATRSQLTLIYILPRIPLRLNTMTNQQKGMMKMKLMIKRKRSKSRSTNWTKAKSMKTTRKWPLLSSLSTNRKLFQTKKRLDMKARLAVIQWSQKTQSRLKLSSAQWVTGMKMLFRKVTSFRTHYCMKLLYDHLYYFTMTVLGLTNVGYM